MNIYDESRIPDHLREFFEPAELGLEPTPAEYVANMVAVFREAKRALRDDGVCFVNLGDSYSSTTQTSRNGQGASGLRNGNVRPDEPWNANTAASFKKGTDGIPAKSMMGIPWRFALAMMDDGWILRNDIIWAKRNPMPESVTDRFTSSHEHVFMFTKRPRYWADMYAVREESSGQNGGGFSKAYASAQPEHGGENHERPIDTGYRNARDVWSLSSEPSKIAHFATMPSKLVEKCLLVGCPETVCAVCGAPWTRVVERSGGTTGRSWHDHKSDLEQGMSQYSGMSGGFGNAVSENGQPYTVTDHGFRPTCPCDQGTARGVVCDPFMGSGTVARTAIKLRRDFCGCDLNPNYVRMATDSLENLAVTLFTL